MSTTETKPRYAQVSDGIRAQIQNGDWDEGDRLPSFADMYREHGASTATMQKAYDQLEKEGFIERRARSGVYVTNPPLVQTGMLAYVVPSECSVEQYSSTSYSMKLLRGTRQEAEARGYQLVLCTTNQIRTSDYSYSGCIVQGSVEQIQSCARLNKPVVSLITEQPGISIIGTDDIAGFKAITDYLLEQGHQRIAIIYNNEDNDSPFPIRLRGYRKALVEAGVQVQNSWERRLRHDGLGYAEYGYTEMCHWLREDWGKLGCTAIVTQNDCTAIGVIKALRQHGYRVPHDVSVTGYDDSGEDAYFDLKLTTIHVPLEDIAQKAVQLLDRLVTTSTDGVQKEYLPTHLVIGESTMKLEGGGFS